MRNLKELFLLVLPLGYVTYILALRLIIKQQKFLMTSVTLWEICFCIFMVLICIFRLYLLLKSATKPKNHWLIILISTKCIVINESIYAFWVDFLNKVLFFIHKINFLLLFFIRKLYLWKKYFAWFVCIFDFLPRTVVVIGFLIDIFVYQCLFYFYYLLPLLLLPLFSNVVFYVLLEFHITNVLSLEENLIITYYEKTDQISAKFIPNYVPPSYIHDIDDYVENHYLPVKFIPDLLNKYTKSKKRINILYIDIIIAILYLIGWSSILFIYLM